LVAHKQFLTLATVIDFFTSKVSSVYFAAALETAFEYSLSFETFYSKSLAKAGVLGWVDKLISNWYCKHCKLIMVAV